jgi:glycerol-3-phosphate dehydrogenase (NAD(P)+)
MTLAIIGGGSWGTALSIVLAPRFQSLRLWVYEADLAERLRATRENDVYLPGLRVPDHVEIVTGLAAALGDAEIVLCVIPSRHARGLYSQMLPHLEPSMVFASATKGLEDGTLLRMSDAGRGCGARFRIIAILSDQPSPASCAGQADRPGGCLDRSGRVPRAGSFFWPYVSPLHERIDQRRDRPGALKT